ncbi:MAG: OmpA family protein [Alphaproteobacteria bacterium]|nr:OmpA family protein [Alphaproteobacteria bacterium]
MPVRNYLARSYLAKSQVATIFALLAFAAASSCVTAVRAQEVSEDEIVRALTPQGQAQPMMHQDQGPQLKTRGLSTGPSQAEPVLRTDEGRLLDSLRGRRARTLSLEERETIAGMVQNKPKIDLEINFDYNSANISGRSLRSVQALGRALTNPALQGSVFVVAGHTDAKGGDAYNQDLSERRADAIKRYLVEKYRIAGTDLVTVGYGKSKLKDPAHPLSGANRRVQVINMENKATASN